MISYSRTCCNESQLNLKIELECFCFVLRINSCEPGVFKSDLSLSTLEKVGLKLDDFKDKLG